MADSKSGSGRGEGSAAADAARGGARAPGRTVADVLRSDRVPAPPPLLEQRSEFLGDQDIDYSRYTSRDFYDREMSRMWNRAWQWACHEDHVLEEGDHYVYNIGPYSVIVVRSAPDRIQAFLNSCPHRGTKIVDGEGAGYCAGFTCPFHGWSFKLDGRLERLPGRWDFPHVGDDTHDLREIGCEVWGGFVFVNLDPNRRPLREQLDVLPDHFSGMPFPLEERRVYLHVQKVLPANWKAAQEAFIEAYHNFETHSAPTGANAQYDVFGPHVSRFIHNIASYTPEALSDYRSADWATGEASHEEMLKRLMVDPTQIDASMDGVGARGIAAELRRKEMEGRLGVDLSAVSDTQMLDSIEYHLFPNMFLFPGISIPMVYRFRPFEDDVDRSLFDLLFLEPRPPGSAHDVPPDPVRLGVDQSYTEVEALRWLAPVYDEDTGNLAMQQEGMKSAGKSGATLGNYQEIRIRNFHQTLDRFLSG